MKIEAPRTEYGAWNPGLETEVPREYLPLTTIFRSENVSTSIAEAHELSDYCGLPVHELVAFRADRLIVHELLIRVIFSLAVPDGRDYEDLGRNFREIAATILNRYIAPHREELARDFERVKSSAFLMIERELAKAFADPIPAVEADERPGWRRLLAFGAPKQRPRVPWEAFALINPDIWRKFLLDYGSLGAAYKYAGTLSGHEVEIIDKKLDRRMAARAASGEMSHLLIDRFRFDSFVPEWEGNGSSRLLTRFGDLVYMFFMITPPEMTVERAWTRGLKVGRYKAVEDLLAHNVEAFTGMPELFFTWALATGKRVHYEFLDNSVAEGLPPRTVAFGWNGEMTILDIKSMLDIERFRKINIHAQKPEEVYADKSLAPERNVDFLKRCARWISVIHFADHKTGQVYARLENGKWAWRDEQRFAAVLNDPDAKAGLRAIAPNVYNANGVPKTQRTNLAIEKAHTLGSWGEAASVG
jgi:hypothetical protein